MFVTITYPELPGFTLHPGREHTSYLRFFSKHCYCCVNRMV